MRLRNSRAGLGLSYYFLFSLTVWCPEYDSACPARRLQPRSSAARSQPARNRAARPPPPDQPTGPGTGIEPGGFVFHSDVQEVVLHATVIDDKQRMITNLDRNAFTVFEDGKPQIIKSFRHEDIPISLGIVIDNSGSMREKRAKVVKAAINLVRASNPQDEVFVVNFSDEYFLDQPLPTRSTCCRRPGEIRDSRRNRSLRRGRGLSR